MTHISIKNWLNMQNKLICFCLVKDSSKNLIKIKIKYSTKTYTQLHHP